MFLDLCEQETALADHNARIRKAQGVYYTPPLLVDHVVRHALGPLLEGRTPADVADVRIVDPACGAGAFLLGAYQYLLDWYQRKGKLTATQRRSILLRHIHGVEIDERAAAVARLSLLQRMTAGESAALLPDLGDNIRVGNALLGPDRDPAGVDWTTWFPARRFTVVIGNPPWGQKAIRTSEPLKRYLWQRFPSSAGIFDLFRPFVELGVRLTADGGRFGMVLPDIVLLKDYPRTRRFLLDQLTLERIDWWGRAFAGATIDTATVIGRKAVAPPGHRVAAAVHSNPSLAHHIPQDEFRANPRHLFNLHLTTERRQTLQRLRSFPRLGDGFEVHEGVHSGNLRAELFVSTPLDATCRELLFGRDEIVPYHLRWHGRYVRLGVMPLRKTRARYANLGRPEWYARDKVLVRRTGDRVLAAVDRCGRYVSNNFFLVIPRPGGGLDLDGLCALLNSRFMTWYFRTVEPRRGRAFAELKIKHIRDFPLPPAQECARLNELGRQRRTGAATDAAIDVAVGELFDVPATGPAS